MIQADTVTRESADERGAGTKTSVTIPDNLLIEAKAYGVIHKTSVQDLLIAGLRRELDARKAPAPTEGDSKSADTAPKPARRE